MIIAKLRAQIPHPSRGGRGRNPRAHLMCSEPRYAIDLGVVGGIEAIKTPAEEFLKKVAVPAFAWRQAGTPSFDQVARGSQDTAFARIQLVLRWCVPHDEPARHVRGTTVE